MGIVEGLVGRVVKRGQLTVRYADGSERRFGRPDPAFEDVTVRFVDRGVPGAIARDLRLGAAEAFMDGRLVIIALMGGHEVEGADIRPIMVRRLTVTGSTMRPRTTEEKGAIARALEEKVWPVLSAGRCGPRIHATFPIAEAAEAHRLMESSTHIGKIVLTLA